MKKQGSSKLDVINNEQTHRFEITMNGKVAFTPYNLKDDTIDLYHTEVPEEFRGQGAGTKLALYALNYAKDHHLKINVYCPFITKYIEEHDQWKPYVKHFMVRYK